MSSMGSPIETGILRDAAIGVLDRNDLGTMTTAAPHLYPHQWSWDAAFVTIGLSRVSVRRAITELSGLLRAQWSTGMVPHIVFAPGPADFSQGPSAGPPARHRRSRLTC